MKKTWIVLAVIAVLILLAYSSVKNSYNSMVTGEEGVTAQWSQVENVYQRRTDLIPNLVNTVKGYADFEKETLTQVIEARAKATQVTVDPTKVTRSNDTLKLTIVENGDLYDTTFIIFYGTLLNMQQLPVPVDVDTVPAGSDVLQYGRNGDDHDLDRFSCDGLVEIIEDKLMLETYVNEKRVSGLIAFSGMNYWSTIVTDKPHVAT